MVILLSHRKYSANVTKCFFFDWTKNYYTATESYFYLFGGNLYANETSATPNIEHDAVTWSTARAADN